MAEGEAAGARHEGFEAVVGGAGGVRELEVAEREGSERRDARLSEPSAGGNVEESQLGTPGGDGTQTRVTHGGVGGEVERLEGGAAGERADARVGEPSVRPRQIEPLQLQRRERCERLDAKAAVPIPVAAQVEIT